MNPTGKKFTALFLVFFMMMLSVNLYAKEKRGAKLEIWKKDGQLTKGELIAVQENSLLVLDTGGKDVSIDISDISFIRVVKKKPGKGALKGLLIGGGGGALVGARVAIVFGAIGALIGAICGLSTKVMKTFQIEGMTDLEISDTLDYLRKKARIRNYK